MCHWKKWIWPGILTVAILSALALWMKTDFIQNDLQAKATQALQDNGQSWASVSMDGRDATIIGSAPSEQAQGIAADLTDNAYEVRIVDNRTELLAAQSPYTLKATRDGRAIELTGFVPDEETRTTIVDAAKEALPNTDIADNMTLARGAPETLAAMAGFGFTQLNNLTTGEMSLSDSDLSLKGAAADRATYDGVNTALDGTLPGGAKLAMKEITAPTVSPYTWGADYSGEEVTLTGFVPSAEMAQKVIDQAKSALPDAEVIDNQLIATGEPQDFENATNYALQQLPRFTSGNVGLSDLTLTVDGVAKTTDNYNTALGAVAAGALPAGLALANSNIKPATISPYTWGAQYNGSKTVLTGYVPDTATRESVVAKTTTVLEGTEVEDQMQIADGAPAEFGAATDFALEQLPRFSSGAVALNDTALTVEGVSKDSGNYTAAKGAVAATLPAGLSLATEKIIPSKVSPYTWRADYDGSALTLTGYTPSEDARSTINEQVKAALPQASVIDNMRIAQGQPDDFTNATGFAIEQLPRFTSGYVALSDADLTVEGLAKTSEEYSQGKEAVTANLASGLKLASEKITPPTVSPYKWEADYDGQKVVLNGLAPNEDARAKVIAAANKELPDAEVVDQMKIAAGAPDQYEKATAGAIALLPRFSSGDIALTGTDLTVNGIGKSSADFNAADDYAKGTLPGGAKLVASNIQPPANDGPWNWKAVKDGNRITLSGLAPSNRAKSNIAREAGVLNPDMTIVDNMTIVTGEPDGFIANSNKGLSLLDGLTEGTATIVDEKLSIVGKAATVRSYEISQSQIAADLDAGYSWDIRDIQPPIMSPFSWSIDNTGDKAVLGGFVPNRGLGNTNVAAAKVTLSKDVDDLQRIAGGAPDGFGNAAATLISGTQQLENSRGTITGNSVFIQGRAGSEEDAERIGKAIGDALPTNFKYRKQISYPLPVPEPPKPEPVETTPEPKPEPEPEPEVVKVEPKPEPVVEPPKVCEIDFAAIINNEKINFETSKADIKESSFGLLDRIAASVKVEECANAKIEVGGHTDSRGSEGYNQRLSEARAKSVVSYMVEKQGIRADAFSAKGFGELQPIAPNTKAERAKNRRIEFKLLNTN